MKSNLALVFKIVEIDELMRKKDKTAIEGIKDLLKLIKSKTCAEDVKFADMLYCLRSIAVIKVQEVNQDDVYDIYLKYEKYFKSETEEDKIRLRYFKPDFLNSLFS